MDEDIIIGIVFFIMVIFGLYLALEHNSNPKLNPTGEVPRSQRYIMNIN